MKRYYVYKRLEDGTYKLIAETYGTGMISVRSIYLERFAWNNYLTMDNIVVTETKFPLVCLAG